MKDPGPYVWLNYDTVYNKAVRIGRGLIGTVHSNPCVQVESLTLQQSSASRSRAALTSRT